MRSETVRRTKPTDIYDDVPQNSTHSLHAQSSGMQLAQSTIITTVYLEGSLSVLASIVLLQHINDAHEVHLPAFAIANHLHMQCDTRGTQAQAR
jgi:hypothetical protein